MSLTVEELMKPRYRVMDNYPKQEWPTGTIITIDIESAIIDLPDGEQELTGSNHVLSQLKVDNYPHLFEKLGWWVYRTDAQLPEYVKCISTSDQKIMPGMVLRVKWKDAYWGESGEHNIFPYTNCFEPSTEAEYLTYKQNNP